MQKVIVIAGPTGVGKTSLSISLAKSYEGEIISGDSMQVYQEMSIGTAKIKKNEMQNIPHHLVDCMSYQDEYNVKVFQEKARAVMHHLEEVKKVPIVCGGTGLYIKSLLYDYEFIDHEVDKDFEEFLKERSPSELYAMLKHVDNEATKNIHAHNVQRMVRAISMAHEGNKKSEVIANQQHILLYDVFFIGLTCRRELLYDRINTRVDKMMDDGLLNEVLQLVEQGADFHSQSMQSIGYKEWKDYLSEQINVAQCVDAIKKNTRNFAKRQYTWFKNQLPMHWYDIEDPSYYEQLCSDLDSWIKKQ